MNRTEQIEEKLKSRPKPSGFPPEAVLPDHGGLSIASIPQLIRRVFEPSAETTQLGLAADPEPASRVVLFVIDGMGYRTLNRLIDDEAVPTLAALTERGSYLPITSVFPSTTVSALTSIATGLPPIAHGMLGYRLYLREISAITDMIRLRPIDDGTPASDEELDVGRLFSIPTFCERFTDDGIRSHVLLPRSIAGSGLSRILYRGCSHIEPTSGLADMCVQARRILAEASDRTFLTLYWPGLDAVAHERGPASEAYRAEAAAIDSILGRQLVDHAERTLLIVTSDHGIVTMEPSDYIELADLCSPTKSLAHLPVGEPRATYLHLENGEQSPQRVESLRDGLLRIGRDRVVSSGLLGNGPQHPEALHRIGDELIVSTASAGLYHPYPGAPRLRGMHGGLTEEEMLVPLIAASL